MAGKIFHPIVNSKINKASSEILKFISSIFRKFCRKNILLQRSKFCWENSLYDAQIAQNSNFFKLDVCLTINLNIFMILYVMFEKVFKLYSLYTLLNKFWSKFSLIWISCSNYIKSIFSLIFFSHTKAS